MRYCYIEVSIKSVYNDVCEVIIMSKKRINVTMSEELLNKIDRKCHEMGVTRSSFISTKLADYISKEDMAFDSMVAAAKEVMAKSIDK